MECKVFSTTRLIRDYVAESKDSAIAKLYTMEEFLSRIVVVENRAFISESSRVSYLFKAIENLDISLLGFEKEFVSFLKNSDFLFRFFEELFAERVNIDDIKRADIYEDFEDHLEILQKIYFNYAKLLDDNGLVDKITIDKYRINRNFLKQFLKIELFVDGYLSGFELEVLNRVEQEIHICFNVTPFNKKLIERLEVDDCLDSGYKYTISFKDKKVIDKIKNRDIDLSNIEVAAFDQRVNQVGYVLKKVEEFVKKGADPSKIVVILPDESFADYLKLFDTMKNFNYAMGTPFVYTKYYKKLSDLYHALVKKDPSAVEKIENSNTLKSFEAVNDFSSFLNFIDMVDATPIELDAIAEARYIFEKESKLLLSLDKLALLKIWLQRLQTLSLDDVGGGKITVMGLLESRGKYFDGVVIVDFNEGVVPKVSEKDIFLNSSIRQIAKMPTRKDKENLQKNFYYSLFQNSKYTAISYVDNETMSPSRFLRQLGLKTSEVLDSSYKSVIAQPIKSYNLFNEEIIEKNPFLTNRKLTPTKLKDYLICKRRFYYRYILGIKKDETDEDNIGSLIHSSLEEASKNKRDIVSKEEYYSFVMSELFKRVKKAVRKLEISIDWEERIKKFCYLDFKNFNMSKQTVIEGWCSVEFNGFLLSAKIDRVDELNDAIRLIDYKTSKSVKKLLDDEREFQPTFYTVWAKDKYPDMRVSALYWDIYGGREMSVDTESKTEKLKMLLDSLVEPKEVSFKKCEDESECRYCYYKTACGRE